MSIQTGHAGRWETLGVEQLDEAQGDLLRARADVAAAELIGAEQEQTRQRFVDLLAGHPDALLRTCRPGHLTGSAVVVDAAASRLLVLWHNKAQRWLQPGGHADGDGNLAHVAWREACEETGIEALQVVVPALHLDVHEFRPPDEDPHLHFDIRFLVLAPAGAVVAHNDESSGAQWVTLSELKDLEPDQGLLVLAERGLLLAGSLQR
jgi:8-oxo-dGTP pyrophosphatase MutT (NUDIX family)